MIVPSPATVQAIPITCHLPHSPWWHLPVGIFAVLSGLAAVVVALRGELSRREKVVWIAGISLLTILELTMIMWNDSDAVKERTYAECELQRNFQTIESEDQKQFNATMSSVGKVFDKTKDAADTAKESVLSMTGADSYLVIFPEGAAPSTNKATDGRFILLPTVIGRHVVWDAEVSMGDGLVDKEFYSRPMEFFKLTPITASHLAGFGKFIQPSKTGIASYGFQISTRGPSEIEDLQVQFDSIKQLWMFRYWLFLQKSSEAKKGPPKPALIKHLDWTPISYPMLR